MARSQPIRALARLLWAWLPPLLLMGVLYALSAQPVLLEVGGEGSPWDALFHKGAHFGSYALLAWLFHRALSTAAQPPQPIWLISAALAVGYGLTDELHQVFIPGRSGRLLDVLIDAAGAAAAMALLGWWQARRSLRQAQAAGAES